MSRRRLSLIGALALTAVLAGCGGGAGGDDARSIVLYNGQHPQLTDELVTAFEKQTGISVQVRTNDGIVLADQLLQEGRSSPADVYLTENSPELSTLDQHGLLAKLPASTLKQVPGQDEPPSGDWAPVARRVSGLAHDPARVPPATLPRSILELAQPAWKGKVAIAPTDSDFPPLVGAVIAAYGTSAAQSWLAGPKRNAQLFQSDEAVVAAVNRGDVATGVINQYYWYRLRLELGSSSMHSSVYYFPGPQRRIGREHLGRRSARLEPPPTRGKRVRRFPGQRRGSADPRPQLRLRVPGAPRRRAQSRAAATLLDFTCDPRRGRARERPGCRQADPTGRPDVKSRRCQPNRPSSASPWSCIPRARSRTR